MTCSTPSVMKGIKVALDATLVILVLIAAGCAFWIAISPLVMVVGHHDAWIFAPVMMADIVLDARAMPEPAGAAGDPGGETPPEESLGRPATVEDITAILSTRTHDWLTQFGTWGFALLAVVAGIGEVELMRRIVRTAIGGQPFAEANARRLQWIGIITLAGGVVGPALAYVWSRLALASTAGSAAHLKPWFEIEPWFLVSGLITLGLATIFRHGRRLEEDQSLTV